MSQWISVEERSPLAFECAKDRNQVISDPIWVVGFGVDNNGNAVETEAVHLAQYYFPLNEYWGINTTNPIFGVTRWMPVEYPPR
jgi:hypothetical protein